MRRNPHLKILRWRAIGTLIEQSQEGKSEKTDATRSRYIVALRDASAGAGALHRRAGMAGFADPREANPDGRVPDQLAGKKQTGAGGGEAPGDDHGLQVVP